MNTSSDFAAITTRRKMKTKPKMKPGKAEPMPEMRGKKGMPPAFMKKKGAKRGR